MAARTPTTAAVSTSHLLRAVALVLWLGISSCSSGDVAEDAPRLVRAAVAANFAVAHEELVRRFQTLSGIEVETSLGSTGLLYTQIANGAPYDVFLAADTARPSRLETEDHVVSGMRFTYAVGRLVLYAPDWDLAGSPEVELGARSFRHLAIANPTTAPYGAAALQAMESWGLRDELQARLVRGESVGQAFQFVKSGAAEAGLVARSQVTDSDTSDYLIVPRGLHRPLRHDAVLLRAGEGNAGARAFLEFLRSEEGRQVIASFGYELP